jgi:kynureninase
VSERHGARPTILVVPQRWDLERARARDREDVVGNGRGFLLPGGIVYLDGNSLGALPANVPERVRRLVEDEWATVLGLGWSRCGWMEAPERVGDRIAALVGARPGEVLVADTTSIALAKLLGAALRARAERQVILSSSDNFPSDLYAAAGAARLAGAELRVVDRSELHRALGEDVAVCCLTQVDFRTGELHDMASLTEAAHRVGALSLWDLCHSAGVLPVALEEHGVDLAVGCTYKYLNGGPGSPSFLYVRTQLQAELENPLPGWLGHDVPFAFDLDWQPTAGIRRFLTSTPPVLALAALDAALDAFEGISMAAIREKSMALGQLFIEAVQDFGSTSLTVASPLSPEGRGSQVSLRHARAPEVVEAAIGKGVIGDFRAPDLCRFGFSPLCLSYEDVLRAAKVVVEVADSLTG